ncbi:MAG TPA: hypothetical protein VEZ90_06945 [Blastocatellia bacterium]|nr:hypothetical protein [Blastocatellia bacterium]
MVDATKTFRTLFPQLKSRYDERKSVRDGLVCKEGYYKGCVVLKLQKTSWTNDDMNQVENESGIFFSIWIDEKAAASNRAYYSVHALKLRQLKGYSITSRDFAVDFRNRFAPMSDVWPNVSTDYGPQNLMQGWIGLGPNTTGSEILALLTRFEQVTPLIDSLLESRRK